MMISGQKCIENQFEQSRKSEAAFSLKWGLAVFCFDILLIAVMMLWEREKNFKKEKKTPFFWSFKIFLLPDIMSYVNLLKLSLKNQYYFVVAGAFIPGVPVQPVLLRYPNKLVCSTFLYH